MTFTPYLYKGLQLAANPGARPDTIIHVKDILDTWCSVQGHKTPHRYEGNRLVCLECEKEAEAQK